MKRIDTLVGQIVDARRAHRPETAPALVAPPPEGGYPEPVLPDALQRQVDALESVRYGDFRTAVWDPSFDPEAARFAAEQRLALLPAPPSVIRAWYRGVTESLSLGDRDGAAMFRALLLVCGDYPAACWSREAARAVIREAGDFWPSATKIDAVLSPIAERMKARLQRLDRIARADPATSGRFHTGPARASTVPFNPTVPSWAGNREIRHRIPDPDDDEPISISASSVDAQLAALGVSPADVEAARQKAALRHAQQPSRPRAANDRAPPTEEAADDHASPEAGERFDRDG